MKKLSRWLGILLAATLVLATAGCGGGQKAPDGSSAKPDRLVLAWFGGPHEPILKEHVVKVFKEKYGVDVVLEFGSLGDRITKLYAEKGRPSIDVALVSINTLPKLVADGIVEPANPSLPGYENLKDEAKVEGGYGISLIMTLLGYNPSKVQEPPDSWFDLWDARYRGHVGSWNLPDAGGMGLLTIISKLGGGSESNQAPGIAKFKELRPGVKVFYTNTSQIEPAIVAGDVWIWPMLSGLAMDMKNRGAPVELAVPQEGGAKMMNIAVIPKGVKSKEWSEKLVSLLLSDDVQRAYAEKLFYAPATKTITLSPDLAEKIHPREGDKLVNIDWSTIAQNEDKILEQWNREVIGR